MSNTWTDAQKNAIEAKNGTVLVSAAAGSGKTAVLVERVIEILTDSEKKVPVENLLVVTFTKAAAAEMRERISKELSKRIERESDNTFLKRQKMFLPSAGICTMDSFCAKLVRENYQNLGILPDFKMLGDNEHEILKADVLSQVLEELYEDESEQTSALLELFSNERNDSELSKTVLALYEQSVAAVDPGEWIENCFSHYFSEQPAEKSVWGKYALGRLYDICSYILEKTDKIILDSGDGKLGKTALGDLEPVSAALREILRLIKSDGGWDEIRALTSSLKLGTFGRFKEEEKDSLYYEIKARRDSLKDDFAKAAAVICCSEEEFKDDLSYLRLVMNALKNCVVKFSSELYEAKKEKGSYYFSDILHYALRLLLDRSGGELCHTPLAKELSDFYEYILIDEFQDTNEAQNELFRAVSRDGKNIFMVGDVKQSIYRFRQAMPEIFISYKDSFEEYKKDNYPAKISLDRNFRSRRGVVEAVNFFFNALMTEELGDVDYKNGEQLVFSADYSETENADAEVHIVEAPSHLGSNIKNESKYVADLITNLMSQNLTVGRKGEERPLRYGDICILMRSVKSNAPVFAGALSKAGIPVHYEKSGGFFDNYEIVTMISMLKVIDNPVQDVPLMSVMLSPMFSFTEDDIAKMRIDNRKGSLYEILCESKSEKAADFLTALKKLRTLSVTLSVGELIRRIFEITSFDSVVGAMPGGEKRELNLRMLIAYSESFEKNGGRSLSGFIRYVDKLRKNNFDLSEASAFSQNDDAVRIMSIHKSKGLEFPVVIIAGASQPFFKEKSVKAIVDRSMGIGALRYDRELHKEFETQPFVSAALKNECEELSENMRVLYVAMTRAREKLFIVGSMYSPENTAAKLYYSKFTPVRQSPVALSFCTSFTQWILLALFGHKASSELLPEGAQPRFLPDDSKIKLVVAAVKDSEAEEDENEKEPVSRADSGLLRLIKEKADYVYPYAPLSGISVKYTASNSNPQLREEFIASETPSFLGKNELTPAQRGTLVHRFMEKCDLFSAERDTAAELDRLCTAGVFNESEKEAVNIENIRRFFESGLYRRMKNAGKLLRECEFTMSVPVCEIASAVSVLPGAENENAVVQGVIDSLIINGGSGEIVDYKTDRAKSEEEITEKYRNQMMIYKRAAEECFGLKNVKITLYSFSMSKEISINL